MSDDNKRNLLFFEASSMKELFGAIQAWQHDNKKRFLSLTTERDGARFCCIAVTNPTEVIIVDGSSDGGVDVSSKALQVYVTSV